ncbi:hypothetical protein D3C72_2247870 [compost metagenome]
MTSGVDDFGVVGHAGRAPDGKIADASILDEDGADLISAGGRVDDAGIVDDEGADHGSFLAGRSASSTAMRTATPIST